MELKRAKILVMYQKKIISRFVEALFPGHRFEYGEYSDRAHSFEIIGNGNEDSFGGYCRFYGEKNTFMIVDRFKKNDFNYPPSIFTHALKIDGDSFTDVVESIFPLDDILDDLSDYVMDHKKMQKLLKSSDGRKLLFAKIELDLDTENLLASIGNIPEVIEAAVSVALEWNMTKNCFELFDDDDTEIW